MAFGDRFGGKKFFHNYFSFRLIIVNVLLHFVNTDLTAHGSLSEYLPTFALIKRVRSIRLTILG